MEIYDRQQRGAGQKNPNPGYVNITSTTLYINTDAGVQMKLSKNKKIVYGKKYNSLMVGITDKGNSKFLGWNPNMQGSAASIAYPPQVKKNFARGKYTLTPDGEKDNITWFRLKKIK